MALEDGTTSQTQRRDTQLPPRAVWRLLGAVALVEALDHMPPVADLESPHREDRPLASSNGRARASGGSTTRR